jgi:DNA helicase HerA-like ATPase
VPKNDTIRLPRSDDRSAVIGRTGSGKTQLGVWLLSTQDIDTRVWIIIDYKGDELINAIDKAVPIGYDVNLERLKPGLYILRVLPGDEESLSEFFQRIWMHEDIGLFIDEGYMIGNRDRYFNACLTQGRSKHIPMIVLTQRPLWLSRFVFSEASYFFVFDITHSKDRGVVKEYVKDELRYRVDERLPQYHSLYYDVGRAKMEKLGPVPDGDEILALIDAKLPKQRRTL